MEITKGRVVIVAQLGHATLARFFQATSQQSKSVFDAPQDCNSINAGNRRRFSGKFWLLREDRMWRDPAEREGQPSAFQPCRDRDDFLTLACAMS
jgi:hypothetical protein